MHYNHCHWATAHLQLNILLLLLLLLLCSDFYGFITKTGTWKPDQYRPLFNATWNHISFRTPTLTAIRTLLSNSKNQSPFAEDKAVAQLLVKLQYVAVRDARWGSAGVSAEDSVRPGCYTSHAEQLRAFRRQHNHPKRR